MNSLSKDELMIVSPDHRGVSYDLNVSIRNSFGKNIYQVFRISDFSANGIQTELQFP